MVQVTDEISLVQHVLDVDFPPKAPIHCMLTTKKDAGSAESPALLFTHGAGGTLKSEGIANFVHGFARNKPILCFQGNMNLKSRSKMFSTVIDNQSAPECLGGRSMGARAAVMAANDQTTHLVLVSYPLHTLKEIRDQILIDLPAHVKVIFISGDHDTMCDLQLLREVRGRMNCTSWQVTVQDADHGMNVKPKVGTQAVGEKTGEIVAAWLESCDPSHRESKLLWKDDSTAQFSGWFSEDAPADSRTTLSTHNNGNSTNTSNITKKRNADGDDSNQTSTPRPSKRKKQS